MLDIWIMINVWLYNSKWRFVPFALYSKYICILLKVYICFCLLCFWFVHLWSFRLCWRITVSDFSSPHVNMALFYTGRAAKNEMTVLHHFVKVCSKAPTPLLGKGFKSQIWEKGHWFYYYVYMQSFLGKPARLADLDS